MFSAAFLLGIGTIAAIRGRRSKALPRCGILLGVYLACVVGVSLFSSRKFIEPGQNRCWDDWCIAVAHASRTDYGYDVDLRLSSRARRVAQREQGVRVYLVDIKDHLYEPFPEVTYEPLDMVLQPGQSVVVKRQFRIPQGTDILGLTTRHSSFPGVVIIGDDGSLFHKSTLMKL